MTNTEILQTSLLTSLDSQRKFLLQMAIVRRMCPGCGALVSQVEAYGDGQLDSYPVDTLKEEYTCPACKEALVCAIPLVGQPFWMLKRAVDAAKARRGTSS